MNPTPPVRYVDIDLTDNVPLPLPPPFRLLSGRRELVWEGSDGRVVVVPKAPLKAPSAWGVLS